MTFNQAPYSGPEEDDCAFSPSDSDLKGAIFAAGCITAGAIGVGTVASLAPSTILGTALVANAASLPFIAGSK